MKALDTLKIESWFVICHCTHTHTHAHTEHVCAEFRLANKITANTLHISWTKYLWLLNISPNFGCGAESFECHKKTKKIPAMTTTLEKSTQKFQRCKAFSLSIERISLPNPCGFLQLLTCIFYGAPNAGLSWAVVRLRVLATCNKC